MSADVNVNFFPKTESIVFLVLGATLTIVELLLGLQAWHMIITIVLVYFLIMGGASTINLEEDVLTISSMNPFLGSHEIGIKSVLRIKLLDKIDRKKEDDFGSYFLIYSRRCIIEFLDEEGQKSRVYFSILNKNEEKRVIKGLRKLTKKERPPKVEEISDDNEEDEDEDELIQGS